MTTTEETRENLLAEAERLEADAAQHDHWERPRAAEAARDQAERLRKMADGAPAGPDPDAVADIKTAVYAKLDEARELIERGVSIYEHVRDLTSSVLDVGVELQTSEENDVSAAAVRAREAENVALRARVEELETQGAERDQELATLKAVQDGIVTAGLDEGPTVTEGAPPEAEAAPTAFDINTSVPELLEYVGDDKERARAVLDAEVGHASNTGSEPRKTLVEPLSALVGDGDDD